MIAPGRRALACLSHFNSQCIDKRGSVIWNFARVSTQQQPPRLGPRESICNLRPTFSNSILYRPYATNAVSRPKAHTGRTTSAPRKKASTAKTPTSDPSAATKKPAAKKPAVKKPAAKKPAAKKARGVGKKSKRGRKAKSTKARKKPTKPKKPKKPLTPQQKDQQNIKQLKETALTPPKKLPSTAFSVLLAERSKQERVAPRQGGESVAKQCGVQYRSFSPEQREHYNHLANQNKATNAARYGEWIRSFTPTQIHEANNARLQLKKKTKRTLWPKLVDERLVKGQRSSYNYFFTDRYKSGDFAGLKVSEASKLVGAEWRALSANEKQKYVRQAESDLARYDQEVKAVYNRDTPGHNGDGTLMLPESGNLTSPSPILVFPSDVTDTTVTAVNAPKRPKSGIIWPEGRGRYYIGFTHYGRDIQWEDGVALLRRAESIIDGWINAVPNHASTRVETEHSPSPQLTLHSWTAGRLVLTMKPKSSGFNLGEMKNYVTVMQSFHARYQIFWEWDAQLLTASKTFGIVSKVGEAKLKIT
ncbi:MAG: hypothetical protein LQ338_006307 [Usnochroma carphineum]|nr:MAG: hypothetical protein LQ338_006307 [Usnochroma carphineum]